jgi:hypothetical protein
VEFRNNSFVQKLSTSNMKALINSYHSDVQSQKIILLIILSLTAMQAYPQPAAEFEGTGNFDTGVRAISINGRGVHASSVFGDAVYGFSLVSGVTGESSATNGVVYGVQGLTKSPDGKGVYGQNIATSGTAYGVYGLSASGTGTAVYARATATSGTNYGVHGISFSTSGRGVYGQNAASSGLAYGVHGRTSSTAGSGVYGSVTAATGTNYGVQGSSTSTAGRGVHGFASSSTGTTYGVTGTSASSSGRGVYGRASATSGMTYGVLGESLSSVGRGVYGTAPAYGVYGEATATSGSIFGVYGMAPNSSFGIGVYGTSSYQGVSGRTGSGTGVHGYASSTSGVNYGVYGESASSSGYGVYSQGNAHVNGTFTASNKLFVIDHPSDPTGKYLYHSVVESADMMNMYNGNVVLDENGRATVSLPDWFETLNEDFRYQLTPIGAWAPLFVAERLRDNRFMIAGGEPGLEASWQVTGIRHDPYAEQNRMQVEVIKPASEQGTYLHPEVYGKSKKLSQVYQHNP